MSKLEGIGKSSGDAGRKGGEIPPGEKRLFQLRQLSDARTRASSQLFRGREITPQGDARGDAQNFRTAIDRGITEALSIIQQRFERTLKVEDRLEYHRRKHTEGVISRVEKILRAIQQVNPGTDLVTDKDIALGKLAAAWHDTVQQWQSNSDVDAQGNEIVKRKRPFGENEKASVKLVEAYMRTINKEAGKTIFSERDIQVVREAILLTVPNFDKTLGTVTQPDFAKYKGNLVAQAVALADLGGGGMEGFSTARWEANALFVEENLDFAAYRRAYRQAQEGKETARDPQQEQRFHKRMIDWVEAQIRFNQGRQRQLQQEIASMDPRAQESVKQLFVKYDEAVAGLQSFVTQLRTMDFPTWMADLQNSL